jgi:hypothetical protein
MVDHAQTKEPMMLEKQKKALADERNFDFLALIVGVPVIALLYVLVPALLARG